MAPKRDDKPKFRISETGWFTLTSFLIFVWASILWSLPETFMLAIFSGLLLAFSAPWHLASNKFSLNLEPSKYRGFAGEGIGVSITVTAPGGAFRRAATIKIVAAESTFIKLFTKSNAEFGRKTFQVLESAPRGVHTVGPAKFLIEDPLGLFLTEKAISKSYRITIFPKIIFLENGMGISGNSLDRELNINATHKGFTLHSLRKYEYGDTPKQIHWRASAKKQDLLVRNFDEFHESQMTIYLRLDAAAYKSEREIELAISVAASLGVFHIARSGRVQMVTNFGANLFFDEAQLLEYLAGIETSSAEGLKSGFLHAKDFQHSKVIIVTGQLALQKVSEKILETASSMRLSVSSRRRDAHSFMLKNEEHQIVELKDLQTVFG